MPYQIESRIIGTKVLEKKKYCNRLKIEKILSIIIFFELGQDDYYSVFMAEHCDPACATPAPLSRV